MSKFVVQTPLGHYTVEADSFRTPAYKTGVVILERVIKKGWLFDRREVVAEFYGVVSIRRAD